MHIAHERFPCEIIPVVAPDAAALDALLRVYQGCNDFLALGPNLASMEMVLADLEHSRAAGRSFYAVGLQFTGEWIGVIDLQTHGYQGVETTAMLELLMIAAPWRGTGLGEQLVRWVENTIRADGRAKVVHAGVQANNPGAIRFWQRMGFQIVSEARDMGDGTTAYALEKRLSPA